MPSAVPRKSVVAPGARLTRLATVMASRPTFSVSPPTPTDRAPPLPPAMLNSPLPSARFDDAETSPIVPSESTPPLTTVAANELPAFVSVSVPVPVLITPNPPLIASPSTSAPPAFTRVVAEVCNARSRLNVCVAALLLMMFPLRFTAFPPITNAPAPALKLKPPNTEPAAKSFVFTSPATPPKKARPPRAARHRDSSSPS